MNMPVENNNYHNKGIVFKARLVCKARVITCKNNGFAYVLSGRKHQARFKNNTFIIILKHFKK